MAGYVAGFSGTLISYPMDTAKTWLQTKRPRLLAAAPPSRFPAGTRAASSLAMPVAPQFQNVWQLTRALYKGIAGPLVTVGLVQSLNFAIYDTTRRLLYSAAHPCRHPQDYLHDDSLWHVGVASVTAGACLAFVTSPLVMIKTKQQVQQISFTQAARQTLKGVSRGFGPHFVSETVGRAVYFVAYESCKRLWTTHVASNGEASAERQSISLTGRMVSAGAAGMLCWTLLFPLDVIRSRLFASSECLTAWTMSQRIYREGGIRGFFRGYGISVFRAGPVAALVLPIYDYTLEHLKNRSQ